ncbi:cyclic pyranopterin monophosphate synthase MoaC [Neisseriaceae bacterium B1]
MNEITHLTQDGHTHMVDVSDKTITQRVAIAEGFVHFPPEVYAQIQASHGQTAKGTITEIARIAGIMAAKNTASIIPLCHPMMLEKCKLFLDYQDDTYSLHIRAEVGVTHKTGVEMEALTAVSAAALTVYDMTKALSHDIVIGNIRLVHKSGGKRLFNRKD